MNCMSLESFISIGGISARLTGDNSLRRIMTSAAFYPFITPPASGAVDIRLDESVAETEFDIIHIFDFQKIATCTFGKKGTDYHFVMQNDDGIMLRMVSDGHTYARISRCPDGTWLFFALWMAFNLFGCQRESLSIHASCIVHRHKAILFLGESGTGKSTQSRMWMEAFPGTELLNDDGPFLAPCNGKIHVFGTPWSGKTPCYHNIHGPIKAIIRVRQAPFNRITPLPTLQQIGAILPSFPPAFSRDSFLLQKVLSLVSALLSETPVYQLECLPNTDAARTAHDLLFPEP